MARKPRPVPVDVRRLSIREIVDLWVKEIDIHPMTLERELRRFLLNQNLNWQAGERIDPDTPDDQLPGPGTLVDKKWVEYFCTKKTWPFPEFWFPPDPEQVRRRGRPSHMPAIVQELDRRAEAGEHLEEKLIDQARVLNDWAVQQGHPELLPRSITNSIGDRYRELKKQH